MTIKKAAVFWQAIVSFLFLAVPAAYAQEAAFNIKKPAGQIILATPFKLEIEAVYPDGFTIKPYLKSTDDFEITKFESGKTESKNGKLSQIFTFNVMPVNMGKVTFPGLSWVLKGDNQKSKLIKNPELPLEVSSFINQSANNGQLNNNQAQPSGQNGPPDSKNLDIIDIRPPYQPPPNYWPFVIAMLIAAGLGILLWRRKEAAALAAAEAADTRPPETKAFDSLNELLASGLWEQEKYKQFYNRLADIMRDYITARMNAEAHLLTTADLLRELKKRGRDKLEVASLRKFFGSCDLVKFAKHKPTVSERDSDAELFKLIINQAAPKPAPAPAAEPTHKP